MDTNRKSQTSRPYSGDGSHLDVDALYWQQVADKERTALCNHSCFEAVGPDQLQFRFLNEDVRVDLSNRCLLRRQDGVWLMDDDPLLKLVTVIYLKNLAAIFPMGQDMVGVKDLKEGHFFVGPHELRTAPLLKRFGNDPEGFRRAGLALDGQPLVLADAAFRLFPFPRVPLYLLLWAADDEFPPRLQVLFDRSIENVLPADAIWALVNRVICAFVET